MKPPFVARQQARATDARGEDAEDEPTAASLACPKCGKICASLQKLERHAEYCSAEARAEAAEAKWGIALSHDPEQEERRAALAAVRQCGSKLESCSAAQQDDEQICLKAIAQTGQALQYASARVRSLRPVALAAVKQNGLALQFASEELRADREVAMAALKQTHRALEFCARALRDDASFTVAALQKGASGSHPATKKEEEKVADKYEHRRRLWRRQPGWHVAAPRVPGDGGGAAVEERSRGTVPSAAVAVADIEQALAAGRAASCERTASWPPSRRRPVCASCGLTTADPTRCTVSLSTPSFATDSSPCWACSGRAVLALILKLPVVSSGGLNFRDRVSVASCCRAWRADVFKARIPQRLATRHAGRKWLQTWYDTFEKCIQKVTTQALPTTT